MGAENIEDLFFEFLRVAEDIKPKVIVAENVAGLMMGEAKQYYYKITNEFEKIGYDVSSMVLDSSDYGVPQTRKRVIIVGYPSSFDTFFYPPKQDSYKPTLRDSIYHLKNNAVSARSKNKPNPNTKIPNHEYMIGNFSYIYMQGH